jgi:hypothetical protein
LLGLTPLMMQVALPRPLNSHEKAARLPSCNQSHIDSKARHRKEVIITEARCFKLKGKVRCQAAGQTRHKHGIND